MLGKCAWLKWERARWLALGLSGGSRGTTPELIDRVIYGKKVNETL